MLQATHLILSRLGQSSMKLNLCIYFFFLIQRWTETYVRWSPKGTYLATFHQRGIALWGGEKFKQIQRFSHQGVQLIDFSPCERYGVWHCFGWRDQKHTHSGCCALKSHVVGVFRSPLPLELLLFMHKSFLEWVKLHLAFLWLQERYLT